MTIQNKTVAITGAGRGIGKATALHLAARGARLVLGARNEAEIAAVVKEIEEAGGEAVYRVTDVTNRTDMEYLVGLACERFGGLHVLVNNAGIGPISRFDALRVEDVGEGSGGAPKVRRSGTAAPSSPGECISRTKSID